MKGMPAAFRPIQLGSAQSHASSSFLSSSRSAFWLRSAYSPWLLAGSLVRVVSLACWPGRCFARTFLGCVVRFHPSAPSSSSVSASYRDACRSRDDVDLHGAICFRSGDMSHWSERTAPHSYFSPSVGSRVWYGRVSLERALATFLSATSEVLIRSTAKPAIAVECLV